MKLLWLPTNRKVVESAPTPTNSEFLLQLFTLLDHCVYTLYSAFCCQQVWTTQLSSGGGNISYISTWFELWKLTSYGHSCRSGTRQSFAGPSITLTPELIKEFFNLKMRIINIYTCLQSNKFYVNKIDYFDGIKYIYITSKASLLPWVWIQWIYRQVT